MRKILTVLIVVSLLVSCGGNSKPNFVQDLQPGVHKVKLMEVLQTNNYTYLMVKESGKDQWLAVPKMDAVVGKFYYYKGGMEMPNFESKELNREFESVLFLEKVSENPDLEVKQDIPATTHSAMVTKDARWKLKSVLQKVEFLLLNYLPIKENMKVRLSRSQVRLLSSMLKS